MNEKFRCTEEEWLALHKKCNGDTLKLTREEMYLYKNKAEESNYLPHFYILICKRHLRKHRIYYTLL